MAKTSKKKLQKKQNKVEEKVADINPAVDKFFWLVIPILAIIYFISSKYSLGFYQDDEVAQYINMLQFWNDPWVILGNNPKPGYKIFMVIPALFSYDVVLIINSLFASLAVYFTYALIKAYKIPYAFLGAVLLALQPLFFDLSFRSYSEIFTALCIVIFLTLYQKEKFIWSALVCGYIFTVRQEIAIVLLVLAVIFFRKKEYSAVLALFVFPVIYNLFGFIHTGDFLYVLSEMQKVAGLSYQSQGFLHYFKVYIFIVGPVTLALFLLGFFGFLNNMDRFKDYISKYLLLYVIFCSIFVVQLMTMFNDGPNPGNWRYLLHISPVCAIFAVIGFNHLADPGFKKTHLFITLIFAFLTLVFLSKTSDGFVLTEESEYSKFVIIAIFLAMTLLLWTGSKTKYLNNLSIGLIILALVSLYLMFTPKELSPENISVKEIASYLDTQEDVSQNKVYTNHSLLYFFSDTYKDNPSKFSNINSATFRQLKPGDVIIWESHYGYRPEFGSDINMETIQADPSIKFVKEFISADRRFAGYIFEKQ